MVNGMLSMGQEENTYLNLKEEHGDKRFTFIFYKPKKMRKNLRQVSQN